ncbi:hypothetical protein CANARDRAFT_194303 [[Candida] arabinofermentans NRRL YB-2248]|uniref:Serine aminopeptidase S33 domain-containing protein n=1 Tax=[Candida] arabinofermentans NRRL YB-2248 TaxID=983967 RepID=A0A1E4T731_9ASCO|nr:hypothetical protein CANARDRAFT_194303 [[Candida] arabinofermentans NRRL YB-2248]
MSDTVFPYTSTTGNEHSKIIEFDDCNFATYTWPNTAPEFKGRILLVHGYRDAYGVYQRFFDFMNANGYDVFYFCQRGEGATRYKDGSIGTTNDYHCSRDLDFMIDYNLKDLENQGKPLKLSLLGHSMGGGIVLNYAIDGTHRSKLTSVTTTAPLITLAPETTPSLAIEYVVRFCCTFLPFTRTSKVKTSLNSSYLTADPQFLEYFESQGRRPEALSGTLIETRDFIMRGRKLLKPEFYSKTDKKLPILICHGDEDKINYCASSDSFINKCLGSIEGMQNKKFISYPGGRHCLLIDLMYEQVQNDLLDFYNTYN